ncbi:hypothetical protein [Methylotenera sp.]|uniref:hypothetical protein n=1 Tax=Methylotenera sp. TaxID=2051956 RepID=UPI002486D4B6|nr:hypothetical protein [Methylotenera sp.]MDI1298974.1 hypothetical protein [Methylotenera sp.]
MKSLFTARCKHLVACLLVVLTVAACSQKPLTAKQILDQAYPIFDQKHACWISDDGDGSRYCMKLDAEQKLTLKDGERLYVITSGELVDDKGESIASHANIGSVGAFVAESRNGKSEVIAANPSIQVGSSGVGPTAWKLVKLGPADYWGWQNTWGDCHQGYCGSRYSILAPYGKSVKEVGSMTANYDDTGACGGMTDKLDENGNAVLDENGEPIQVDVDCDKASSFVESSLKIDTQNPNVKVYPILLTLTGRDKSAELKSQIWKFNFDSKAWSYKAPKNYPLADKDF